MLLQREDLTKYSLVVLLAAGLLRKVGFTMDVFFPFALAAAAVAAWHLYIGGSQQAAFQLDIERLEALRKRTGLPLAYLYWEPEVIRLLHHLSEVFPGNTYTPYLRNACESCDHVLQISYLADRTGGQLPPAERDVQDMHAERALHHISTFDLSSPAGVQAQEVYDAHRDLAAIWARSLPRWSRGAAGIRPVPAEPAAAFPWNQMLWQLPI